MVNLTDSKLKIDGDGVGVGITLTHQTTNVVVSITSTAILVNDPSKITFIVPADLAEGDYKLTITTQYAPSAKLKEPRSFIFDHVLNVIR